MAIYTIGDLHLSLGTNKPMDVFGGWGNYVERIEANWRRLVTPADTVVIPGDISWAMKLSECTPDFTFLNELPGEKILLKGNHDYWWETKKKMDDYLFASGFGTIKILFNNAFEVGDYAICGTRGWALDTDSPEDLKILNREVGRLKMSLDVGVKTQKELIVFLHYPPVYGDKVCEEIIAVLNEYNIKRCFFGHLHGLSAKKFATNGDVGGINYKLVSSDALGFVPLFVG
jgi:predicted phosphohydrolase